MQSCKQKQMLMLPSTPSPAVSDSLLGSLQKPTVSYTQVSDAFDCMRNVRLWSYSHHADPLQCTSRDDSYGQCAAATITQCRVKNKFLFCCNLPMGVALKYTTQLEDMVQSIKVCAHSPHSCPDRHMASIKLATSGVLTSTSRRSKSASPDSVASADFGISCNHNKQKCGQNREVHCAH
jgi:hypothetical protein